MFAGHNEGQQPSLKVCMSVCSNNRGYKSTHALSVVSPSIGLISSNTYHPYTYLELTIFHRHIPEGSTSNPVLKCSVAQ